MLSLVTVIFFARPSSSSVMFSSFLPRSSLITVPPVSVAMSAEHRLAAIAEAGRLHGTHVEDAAELVDDEGRERFAFNVFRNDQQRLRLLAGLLQNRQAARADC